MKKKNLLLILALPAILASCSNNTHTKAKVNFVTGYDELSIESIEVNGGKIAKPSLAKDGYTVYGYYEDDAFDVEFNFDKNITEETNIYVKALKGEGTDSKPYEVSSHLSLTALTHLGSEITGKAILTKDITITSKNTDEYLASPLSGSFDGQNHTINFDLETEGAVNETGIFSEVKEGGSIKNVRILGAVNAKQASTGALVNKNYGEIDNVYTSGTTYHSTNGCNNGVSLMTKYDEDDSSIVIEDHGTVGQLSTLSKGGAGSVAGTNYGLIKNSENRMMIQATIGAGGISGINYGKIINCYNYGAVGTTGNNTVNSTSIRDKNFDFSYLGGISGANFGEITQCVNSNQVFVARLPWKFNDAPAGQSDYIDRIRVGGIAGYNAGNYDEGQGKYVGGIITECANYGRVHGDMQVGGIAGYSSGYVSDCFFSSYIGGRSSVGTIVGWQPGDREGDRIGVVQRSVGLSRLVTSLPATLVDEEGNSVPGDALVDISSSNPKSNVYDHFKVAKYASNCVYHNYSGNENPIDLKTGENTSINTTANMNVTNVYNKVGYENGSETGLWAKVGTPNAIVGFNKSWQVYLSVVPAWQKKLVTYYSQGTKYNIEAIAGINYLDNTVSKDSNDAYVCSPNSAPVAAIVNSIPRRGVISNMPDGTVLKWTTVEGDANHLWDGIVKDNITIYPIAVKA